MARCFVGQPNDAVRRFGVVATHSQPAFGCYLTLKAAPAARCACRC